MILQAAVDQAVKGVCPIRGVSFGKLSDKSTWRIAFDDAATPQQRAAGQAALDAFDLSAFNAQDTSDTTRLAAIDSTISGFSFGGKTLAELKAMDNAAFDTWWAGAVTSLAQANTLLKLLARTMLRRTL